MNEFIFLRPYCLLLLLPLLVAFIYTLKKNNKPNQTFIAAHLLPLFVQKEAAKHRISSPLLLLLVTFSVVIGLAGPAHKTEQPLQQQKDNLIVLFGMDQTLYANDIKPSRLVAAKKAVLNIIHQNPTANIALIAFSGSSYLVAPFTNDYNTLKFFIDALSPEVMPVQGFDPVAAVQMGATLQSQLSPDAKLKMLLVTDQLTSLQSDKIIEFLRPLPLTLDVLNTGTEQGAVIPLPSGSLLKNASGQIIFAKTPDSLLKHLSETLHSKLLDITRSNQYWGISETAKDSAHSKDSYIDIGYYFFIPMLLLAIFFRKGHLFLVLFILSQPPQVEAAEVAQSPTFHHLYLKISTWVDEPIWKGNLLYRAGEYTAAIQAYQQSDSAVSLYNQGNAYAQLQQVDKAIQAYDNALLKDPDLKVAKENKAILELWLKQQEPDFAENEAMEKLKKKTENDIAHALKFMKAQPENSGDLLKRRLALQRAEQVK